MLTNSILNMGMGIMDIIYSFMGVLPSVDPSVDTAINEFFNFMFGGINMLSVFVDMNMLKVLIPWAIAIINADNIIKIIMFILKKLPFIDMK